MRIVRAIVAGERAPAVLAHHRGGLLFEGDARYSNFQRFGVSTNMGLADERGR